VQGTKAKNVFEIDALQKQIESRIMTLSVPVSQNRLKEEDDKLNLQEQEEDLGDQRNTLLFAPRDSELEDGAPCIQEYDDSSSPGKASPSNNFKQSTQKQELDHFKEFQETSQKKDATREEGAGPERETAEFEMNNIATRSTPQNNGVTGQDYEHDGFAGL
jgi:hypothetical protein